MLTQILDFLHRVVLSNLLRLWFSTLLGKGKCVPLIPRSNKIIRHSAVNLAKQIRRREVSSVEVTTEFIDRIHRINPLLKYVVDERYYDALQDAATADELVLSGKYTEEQLEKQFPFLGVPFSTKDHNAVKGMIYSCGIWARKDIRSDVDSDSVALLRKSGGIPFVLTNIPELCLAYDSNNQIHGRTCNPYDSNRMAGGSSGGEGSLISACGSPLGIGTDIGGSIRIPSAVNGIFGHKPTGGIVSTLGTFPGAVGRLDDMHVCGPMSRFSEDLLPALRVMAGENAKILRLDEPVDLTKLKVFYQKDDGGSVFCSKVDFDIQLAVDRAVGHLKGICTTEAPKKTNIKYLKDTFEISMNHYAAVDMAAIISNGKGLNRFFELFKVLFGWSRYTLHSIYYTGKFNGTPKSGPQLTLKENELRKQFEEMLGTDGVFLFPTHPTVAFYRSEAIIHFANISYTSFVNLLGLPSTAVPMGLGSEGLPISVQVIAGRNQDRLCLAVAKELERVFGGWVEPGIGV